ncbi:MAG TPA: YraN family protein [Ruthenibacterium lactatiformans]|nr:YraN family protein [Ruthenibacterium lactatiformans]
MEKNRRKTGAEYERLAGRFLEKQGFHILEYNYRCRKGEIDLIARDGKYLVFCEVKYRKNASKGYPAEAVGGRKQKIISQCAQYYLMEKGLADVPCRFDVVGILGEEISLVKDAFGYIG